ncbi:MAG: hypothetical protein R2765_12485 [Ferruginibacter sp.]|nr:hypothetical protein [Bacteroidota bacterium]MCB0708333.1 hypothetical protein [Chitinophagaceae bacterium]
MAATYSPVSTIVETVPSAIQNLSLLHIKIYKSPSVKLKDSINMAAT